MRALVAALAAACATLVFPVSASALEKGLQTDLTWGTSSSDQDRTITGVKDLGAGWMRITMAWHDIETRKGSYSSTALAKHDQAIAKANAAGVKLLVAVHSSPNWASGTSMREAPPLNPADFADFMRYAATRWRGKVQAWELWNEPNTQTFWPTGQNPAHYAQMLKAAYPAVKAADPNASVLFAGTWNNDYEFLEAAYQAVPDLGRYYDVLATHPYVGTSAPDSVWNDPNGRISKYSFAGYREMRKTMLNHGDDKPIWFTEFGWATFDGAWGVSEATQAAYLTRAYQCTEKDSYVQVAIWYAFRNHHTGGDAQGWEQQLGLTRTDFSQKPAYGAFKSYTSGNGGCTAPAEPAPTPTPAPETPAPAPVEPVAEPAPAPAPAPVEEPTETSEEPSTGPAEKRGLHVRIVRIRNARVARPAVRLRRRSPVAIVGRVEDATRGRVVLRMQRRRDGKWRQVREFRVLVGEHGRFRKRVKSLSRGRWRVRAVYRAAAVRASRSEVVYFRM